MSKPYSSFEGSVTSTAWTLWNRALGIVTNPPAGAITNDAKSTDNIFVRIIAPGGTAPTGTPVQQATDFLVTPGQTFYGGALDYTEQIFVAAVSGTQAVEMEDMVSGFPPGTAYFGGAQISVSDVGVVAIGSTTDTQATDSTSAWSLIALAKGSLKQAELSNTPPSDGFNQTYVMTVAGTAQQGPNHALTGGYVTIKCPQSNSQPLIWGWSNAVGSTDVAGNNGSAIYPGAGASVNLSNLDQLWFNNPNTTDRYVLEAA